MRNKIDIQNAIALLHGEGYTVTDPSIVSERIEVKHFSQHDYVNHDNKYKDGFWYQLQVTKPLWHFNNSEVIKKIENVINDISIQQVQEDKTFWTDDLVSKCFKHLTYKREDLSSDWEGVNREVVKYREAHQNDYKLDNGMGTETVYSQPQPSTTVKDNTPLPTEELMYNSFSIHRIHPKNDLCSAMGCVKYDERIHK